MPSLHFATSMMGARLLSEVGPIAGAIGWGYATALGVALVYLGEHYLIDLIAGAALTEAISVVAPRLAPTARRLAAALDRLQVQAVG
jgi:membrane-associated phospholipid phosphatase